MLITIGDLNTILENHNRWLSDNRIGIRADLRKTDLCGANLRMVDLRGADLSSSNLSESTLNGAILNGVDLSDANLSEADLCCADLSGADLRRANLNKTNLRAANLRGANLNMADICGTDFGEVILNMTKIDKRFISISSVGSRKGTSIYCFDDDHIWCGCFRGSLNDFENSVNKAYANNEQFLKEYTGMIQYIRSLI